MRMKQKILIVGDLHGDWGALNKLISKKNPDVVLQCGDFGWWPKMEVRRASIYAGQSKWILRGIKPQGSIVYWCDGNHEDHEDLESLGRQQKVEILSYPGVIYKPRGTTLKLDDGRIVLFAGGGESIDRAMRTPGFDWFHQEIPTANEYDRMMSHPKVDIVISHTCPEGYYPRRYASAGKLNDPTTMMLRSVLDKYSPRLWYHGHWHTEDEQVSRDTKIISLDYPGHSGRWWIWLE